MRIKDGLNASFSTITSGVKQFKSHLINWATYNFKRIIWRHVDIIDGNAGSGAFLEREDAAAAGSVHQQVEIAAHHKKAGVNRIVGFREQFLDVGIVGNETAQAAFAGASEVDP